MSITQLSRHLFLVFLVTTLLFPGQAQSQEMGNVKTILTNCVVIDCTGNPPMEDMTVVITEDTITEIRKGTYRQSAGENNVRVFDLKGAYVLPGLWNVHSHLDDLLPDPKNLLDDEPVGRSAIRGGRNAMDALRRAFTGVRIVGERDYLDVASRDAFEAGVFLDPRIFASGNAARLTARSRRPGVW